MEVLTEVVGVILRALLTLALLFLLTRLMGRKQVSQLTLFDYIIGISIGSIAAEVTVNSDTPLPNGITGIAFYALAALAISVMTNKCIRIRRILTGKPVLLIQHGKIMEKNLKKTHLDVNDLLAMCRSAGAFQPDEIEFAVFEANGKLSVLKKAEKQPATPQDLQLTVSPASLYAEVVLDGKIMERNLRGMGKDAVWLNKQLEQQGVSAKELLLALCDENGAVTVFRRDLADAMDVME